MKTVKLFKFCVILLFFPFAFSSYDRSCSSIGVSGFDLWATCNGGRTSLNLCSRVRFNNYTYCYDKLGLTLGSGNVCSGLCSFCTVESGGAYLRCYCKYVKMDGSENWEYTPSVYISGGTIANCSGRLQWGEC